MYICFSTVQHSMINKNSTGISIQVNSGETKLQQLINELLRMINTRYKQGDVLPSVNTLNKELGISRDTVFKAYRELKRRKIVDSTPAKGYYVNRELKKILLILDFYSPFKDIVYREIEKKLDSIYSIDLVFHHYNRKLFDSVILESAGRYNAYIVMNFDTKKLEICDILAKIDPSKLLLLDIPVENWKDFDKSKYNYVWQDFDEAVFHSLTKIKDRIKQYRVFHIVNPDRLKHPDITIEAFYRFCRKHKVQCNTIDSPADLKAIDGDCYFILRQRDLHAILSQCYDNNLEPGKHVGILAYNDSPLYEFVSCGITVISTDFKTMGEKASQFIVEGKRMNEIIPTKIILRKSL